MRAAYLLATVFFCAVPASQAGLPSHPDHLKPRPAPEPMIATDAEFETEQKWKETFPRPLKAGELGCAPRCRVYGPPSPPGPRDGWETFAAAGYGGVTIKPKNAPR
jgi:hypothetical protein